jgi:hypothetical protein
LPMPVLSAWQQRFASVGSPVGTPAYGPGWGSAGRGRVLRWRGIAEKGAG